MKNGSNVSITITFLCIMYFSTAQSCSEDYEKSVLSDYKEIKLTESCTYDPEKGYTKGTSFKNLKGRMHQNDFGSFEIQVIELPESRTLAACNLPEELKKEGLNILISGDSYETPPTLNLGSIPVVLTEAKVKSLTDTTL